MSDHRKKLPHPLAISPLFFISFFFFHQAKDRESIRIKLCYILNTYPVESLPTPHCVEKIWCHLSPLPLVPILPVCELTNEQVNIMHHVRVPYLHPENIKQHNPWAV
jgi:hypothetical protein